MGLRCEMHLLKIAQVAKYPKYEEFFDRWMLQAKHIRKELSYSGALRSGKATRYITFAQGRDNYILTPPT